MTDSKKNPQKDSTSKTSTGRDSKSPQKDRSLQEEVRHFSYIGDHKADRASRVVRGTGPDSPRSSKAKKK